MISGWATEQPELKVLSITFELTPRYTTSVAYIERNNYININTVQMNVYGAVVEEVATPFSTA